MVQTVLVPTDFSNNALIATKYAIGIAKELGLKIHIFHAYQPFTSAFQSPLANETDEKRAKLGAEKNMTVFLESIGKASDVQVSHSITKNSIVSAITEYVDSNTGTLLVMGTHGASGTRKDILGSNTYDVAKSISIPILIVPEKTANFVVNNIAFFTDYQQNDVHTLNELRSIVKETNVKCTLVHILKQHGLPTEDALQKLEYWKSNLQQQANYERLSIELVQGTENVETVNEAVERLNADLLLLTLVEGRSFFEKLLHKSLARTIILNSDTPVFLSSKEVD